MCLPPAHVSEVQLSVQRTPANQLIVLCESSGWNPRPLVSLLDSKRTGVLAAHTMISVQPDNLYSVSTWSGVAAEEGGLQRRTVKRQIYDWSLVLGYEHTRPDDSHLSLVHECTAGSRTALGSVRRLRPHLQLVFLSLNPPTSMFQTVSQEKTLHIQRVKGQQLSLDYFSSHHSLD